RPPLFGANHSLGWNDNCDFLFCSATTAGRRGVSAKHAKSREKFVWRQTLTGAELQIRELATQIHPEFNDIDSPTQSVGFPVFSNISFTRSRFAISLFPPKL